MKQTLSPEQQLWGHADALAEIERKLEQKGIDVWLLQRWLDASLRLRDLRERHAAGTLSAVEYDPDEE
jgi:hypothetical protein